MTLEDVAVENVVLSVVFPHGLDLDSVVSALPSSKHQPRKFPSLVYRFARPAATLLIFSSGKAICTGAKSEEEATLAVRKFVSMLRQKIHVEEPRLSVDNIVVSAYLGRRVNVEKLASAMKLSYESERFPGASFKYKGKTILVFSSGRIVCVGSKTLAEARQTVDEVKQVLNATA